MRWRACESVGSTRVSQAQTVARGDRPKVWRKYEPAVGVGEPISGDNTGRPGCRLGKLSNRDSAACHGRERIQEDIRPEPPEGRARENWRSSVDVGRVGHDRKPDRSASRRCRGRGRGGRSRTGPGGRPGRPSRGPLTGGLLTRRSSTGSITPRPRKWAQIRLARFRAKYGLSRPVSQSASATLGSCPAGIGARPPGTRAWHGAVVEEVAGGRGGGDRCRCRTRGAPSPASGSRPRSSSPGRNSRPSSSGRTGGCGTPRTGSGCP